jgi:hypothetical protein
MTPKLQRPAARLFWTGIGRNPSAQPLVVDFAAVDAAPA